jgi:hypothetical protein
MEVKAPAKRNLFNDSDSKLLISLVKENSPVLANKTTNGVQPQLKKSVSYDFNFKGFFVTFSLFLQVWEKVLGLYNASSTNGVKTIDQLKTKYTLCKCH